jgi:hypothetical protein
MKILDIKKVLINAFNVIENDYDDSVDICYITEEVLFELISNNIVKYKNTTLLWGAVICLIDDENNQRIESLCGNIEKLEFEK